MNLFSFGAHFMDEKSCRLYFKKQRDKLGLVCHRCQDEDHYCSKINGVINVRSVTQEYPFAAVR